MGSGEPEPVLLEPGNPLDYRPEELQPLFDTLQEEGFDPRYGYIEQRGFGVTWWEILTIWMLAKTGEAVIDQVVSLATRWMQERFQDEPASTRPKSLQVVLYEGEEGEVVEIIQMKSPNEEPVRKSPADFESYTRRKPPEKPFWNRGS